MLFTAILVAALGTSLPQDKGRIDQIAATLPASSEWVGRGDIAQKANVKVADRLLGEQIPQCTDELYLMFSKNGNRTEYQKPYFNRVQNLEILAATEAKCANGKYLGKVVEYLETIAGERCWTMPAHDLKLTNFDGSFLTIDLGAAHRAETLAKVLVMLKGKLPAEIDAKVRKELERRIFSLYRTAANGQINRNWWFFCRSNWNAVCHSAVVIAALATLDDVKDRATFVEGAERGMRFFLESFLEDGYCIKIFSADTLLVSRG